MSLSLIQGYSSAEEEDEQRDGIGSEDEYGTSSDNDDDRSRDVPEKSYTPLFELSKPSPNGETSLPSAFDVFAEVSRPPDFLNNCVDAPTLPDDDGGGGNRWHSRKRNRKDKRDLPAGVVVEAKAQLVGIHERVRSDIEGNGNANPVGQSIESSQPGGKRVVSVANPNAEDAAELLRMCLQCGVPKTFSNAKGMVCPICGDRPPMDPNSSESVKKKGSMIKDKEKNKRMKGQSSHSSWKSETEMALRQQFD
ncbi:uncharacterized protein LOC124926179 [Impatiens glandulifera]|uniref:uncharacterized protein LOC124926179 n=1 Tax=Impatiens glandulifera TaxID=253017 RepID=UPI001FB10624|nr:uncharacterized protein LOC124926179 [Impatiens glandulifera]